MGRSSSSELLLLLTRCRVDNKSSTVVSQSRPLFRLAAPHSLPSSGLTRSLSLSLPHSLAPPRPQPASRCRRARSVNTSTTLQTFEWKHEEPHRLAKTGLGKQPADRSQRVMQRGQTSPRFSAAKCTPSGFHSGRHFETH